MEETITGNETETTGHLPFPGIVMCSAFFAGSSFFGASVSYISSESWRELVDDEGLVAEPNRLVNQLVFLGEDAEGPSVAVATDCTSGPLSSINEKKSF